MKKVLLYPRVSSDEQAEKGYSLRDQQDKLYNYCLQTNRVVLESFPEDYSAWKGFNRPQWNRIMQYIRQNKGKVDEILFMNWTRFSRNTGEAYAMIKVMKSYGITLNAIEQPLDFNIPESKIMLAVYISVAEADNDRRSMNTIAGIRRGRSEGRYLSGAPFGYLNARDEQDKPILVIEPVKAAIVREIFAGYISGKPKQEILNEAKVKGYNRTGHGAIERLISNPTYAGLIFLSKTLHEEERMVKGLHQPIVSEKDYWAANARLKGEKIPEPKLVRNELPLRGVLLCEGCGQPHSGGRCRSKSMKYYWYYQCHRGCRKNYLADRVHLQLREMLESMSLPPHTIADLVARAEEQMHERLETDKHTLRHLQNEIAGIKSKIRSLNEKYIEDRLDHATYAQMKAEYSGQLVSKEVRIKSLSHGQDEAWRVFRKNIGKLSDLYFLYEKRELPEKQELIRALFPGCLKRVSEGFQTPYLMEPFYSNSMSIKHLSVIAANRIIPINSNDLAGVPDENSFKHLLQIIAA